MRNLMNDDGELDLDVVTECLLEQSARTGFPPVVQDERDQRIAIGLALLDIARSQRTIALESSLAMRDAGFFVGEAEGEGDDPADDVDLTEAEAGTRVMLRVGNDPDEGPRTGALTGAGGISEGAPWVGVQWDDDHNPPFEHRVYVAHLLPEPVALADDAPDPRDAVDDIDGDFDEASSPSIAPAQLVPKAKKKAGKKS